MEAGTWVIRQGGDFEADSLPGGVRVGWASQDADSPVYYTSG